MASGFREPWQGDSVAFHCQYHNDLYKHTNQEMVQNVCTVHIIHGFPMSDMCMCACVCVCVCVCVHIRQFISARVLYMWSCGPQHHVQWNRL